MKRTEQPRPVVVNLEKVCIVERIGPSYDNLHFKLKFWGNTPGGKDMRVIIDLPAWGVEHIAGKLWEVLKEQERHIANNRDALKGSQP